MNRHLLAETANGFHTHCRTSIRDRGHVRGPKMLDPGSSLPVVKNGLWNKSLTLILCSGLVLGMSNFLQSQTIRKIQAERMERDLDIMEGILARLFNPSASKIKLWLNNPRGFYLEGYGIVFQTDAGGAHQALLDARRIAIEKEFIEVRSRLKANQNQITEISHKTDEFRNEPSFSENLEELKGQIIEFFGTYADAIGQLRRTDRITVLVRLTGDNSYYNLVGWHPGSEYSSISTLEASVQKSDIIDYRRGQITDHQFEQSVTFEERNDHDAKSKNLEIMASIMNTALSKKYQKNFSADGRVNGIRLDGLGALFFINGSLYSESAPNLPEVIDIARTQKGTVILPPRPDNRSSRRRDYQLVQDFKDALLEVVGDYGHTLRTLKSTDYVVVAINFQSLWDSDDQPQNLIVRIRKRDLDRYNRGHIKFSQFRRLVEFKEY